MKKKTEVVKTKRLTIMPRTKAEMRMLIENERDPHLKSAYQEMLVGMNTSPETINMYTNWKITLKDSGKIIGGVGFKGGPNENHEVEIGIGIDPKYQNQKYGTEALQAMMQWVLQVSDVFFIQAITEEDNEYAVKMIEDSTFTKVKNVEEGVLYEVEKPKAPWKYVYMLFGLAIGTAVASAIKISITLPALGGIVVGFLIGLALDKLDSSNRVRKG
ncbi:MAG TPA: GNAT family N-acetyltransferase [Anaerovoracaceae bacterium]|nr:GNAT family N-acetyltransferase [Anaerovoracaceae bacterium]